MSKLEELILKLCPGGVEFKNLGDVAKFTYGFTGKAQEKGSARFIRITDITEDGNLNPEDAKFIDLTDENKKYLLQAGDLLMARTGATFGKTLYVPTNEPAIFASFLIKITLDQSVILNRYYWHFAKSTFFWDQANNLVSKAAQPQFNSNVLRKIEIPIPPLKIQSEIVRILDTFTNLISELNTELILRRKQLQYYRDQLLTFDSDVEFVSLGDVCKILRGKRLTTKELIKDGQYPVIHGGTSPMGYYDKFNRKAGTTIVINTGNAGCVFYIDAEFWSSDACFSLYPNEKILDKFLYFVVSSKEESLKRKIRVAAMPTIDSNAISDLKIPVPPVEKQKKIVDILDRFDKLCNDLTSGIPAEINARKKQFQYYQDKLLTFSEIKKEPR